MARFMDLLCQNRQCSRVQQQNDDCNGEESPFCSYHCAYIHALDVYRHGATSNAQPLSSSFFAAGNSPINKHINPRQSLSSSSSNTMSLICCGIDPWSPAAEIHMRQQTYNELEAALDGYFTQPNRSEFVWGIENITYRVSFSLEYEKMWLSDDKIKIEDSMMASIHRYHLVTNVLLLLISRDKLLVSSLLKNDIHPSVFYGVIINSG